METCYKDGKLIINKLSKNYTFDIGDVPVIYKQQEYKEDVLPSLSLEDYDFLTAYDEYMKQGYSDAFTLFGWLNPYSLSEPILSVLDSCLEESLTTGEVTLIPKDTFNYLLHRHYITFRDLLMKWAFSLNLGKVTLYNAREALSRQEDFNLEEKVFIFKPSTFMKKGKLTKFKNIARKDVKRKIVKSSMKEEPIFIIKFTDREAKNLATLYKEEVDEERFYFYDFIIMLICL